MNVKNKKCITRLSVRNLKMTKTRSVISVIAIALTTILFTSLFTIIMTIGKGFEESNFRQVGTYSHGEFKRLTKEQYLELRDDKDIKEYGLRRIAGFTTGEAFQKNYAEVSYMDKNAAKWGYTSPEKGALPKENTNEAAADTMVLSCLGIEPEIGKSFTLTIDIEGIIITEDFVLSGYWEYDNASPASHVLIPESRLEELFTKYNVQFNEEYTGKYGLNVMLKSDRGIEYTLTEILERHGYISGREGDNSIAIGVNWGYIGEGFGESLDAESLISIGAILVMIIFTGYLIIYNIFRISVANEIRYYGMLKTIGTTQKQIKRIVILQALMLSAAGIPLGLAAGWGVGCGLTPVVMNELDVYQSDTSASPLIFIFSAVFALITVLISCFIPAKTAASVTPVEALRYTEGAAHFKERTGKKGVSLFGMAAARLAGSKGKTILTVASLSLSVVLFTVTYTFSNSFDMDKYLLEVSVDFLVADSNYFRYDWDETNAISVEEHEFLRYMDGVTDSFVTYGIPMSHTPHTFYSEDYVRSRLAEDGNDDAVIENYVANSRDADGLIPDNTMLLGMEEAGLSKLDVFEGDITKLSDPKYIAVEKSDTFKLGDKVKIRYSDKFEYVNTQTGSRYKDAEEIPLGEWEYIEFYTEEHDVEYEIAAVIDNPHSLGYRYYMGSDIFVIGAEELLAQSPISAPLYIAFDTTDEAEAATEDFLAQYINNNTLNYDSRAQQAAEFESFRRMFVILGTALSVIVGLVGVLNFINTVLTSISARQRELAALQAIGMTGRQLCTMLIWEGIMYTAGAAIAAIVLNLMTIPFGKVLENVFWFCEYKFTVVPTLVTVPFFVFIGIIVPLVTYKILSKKSVVERLRVTDN